MTADIEVGPQYSRDNDFTARMRFHQSWYRATHLQLECGTGPHAHSTRKLGSMLTRDDESNGKNFVILGVFHLAQRQLPRTFRPPTPTRNAWGHVPRADRSPWATEHQ